MFTDKAVIKHGLACAFTLGHHFHGVFEQGPATAQALLALH